MCLCLMTGFMMGLTWFLIETNVDNLPHNAFYWKSDHIQAMRKGDWKFLLSTRDKWMELYNMSNDKYERIMTCMKLKPGYVKPICKMDLMSWLKGHDSPLPGLG